MLVALVAAFGGGAAPGGAGGPAATKPAKIVFVNVGQGDGVVMRVGGKIIVADTGEFFPEVLDETLRSLKAKQIDVAILSHPHDDHVKNLIRLIRDFDWTVKLAVLSESNWWGGTVTNRALIALLKEKNVPLDYVSRGDGFDWGGGKWQILNPPANEFSGGSDQSANASIAYLLTVNGIQSLFTGDIEPKVARRIAGALEAGLERPVDVFLATHHGSKHGSTKELLDAIDPRWAVLSAGAGNRFKHPSAEAIARLVASGASIWCTDTNGSITARISAAGRLTWRASLQRAPWWSGRDQRQNGTCAGR